METTTQISCAHCGDDCHDNKIHLEDHYFCCEGCKLVFELLDQNGLCTYYNLDENPGISLKKAKSKDQFAYLDDAIIGKKLLDYEDENMAKAIFSLPQIHCSACIWLLENLHKLNPAFTQARVNFLKREIALTWDPKLITLRGVVELLSSIGYEPHISFDNLEEKHSKKIEPFFYKLGIAGFCFGNIMLLSFPEYLGLNPEQFGTFFKFFGWLNLLLALPVVFYSATDYYRSAWTGLQQKHLNIDVPISIGIIVLFLRSAYEIISFTGAGFMDSLAGLVFFLLVGKWFQNKTYQRLSFDRDYKSYFPLAIRKKLGDKIVSVAVNQLNPGDTILINHKELIPADGILREGKGELDYSFVTGESESVLKQKGEQLFAGGRQLGGQIEMELIKDVSQSYLTQLWNNDAFQKSDQTAISRLVDKVAQYFTIIILGIATVATLYWLPEDVNTAFQVFTAVLIIACPCALALASPFTYGNAMRILGKVGFYVKNTQVIEQLSQINAFVFDKTGTLTSSSKQTLEYRGQELDKDQIRMIKTLAAQSNHPVSRAIFSNLNGPVSTIYNEIEEIEGMGIQGKIEGNRIQIGTAEWVGVKGGEQKNTWVRINDNGIGAFVKNNQFRNGVFKMMQNLMQKGAAIFVFSGDNEKDKPILEKYLPGKDVLRFHQTPDDKLKNIKKLQEKYKVLMAGDGLNDAGALKQSDVGVAIAEDVHNFTPACDVILDANKIVSLDKYILFSRATRKILMGAFLLSFLYNIIGLSFAVQGMLSPIVAAILMPLSSISVVLFGTIFTSIIARIYKV